MTFHGAASNPACLRKRIAAKEVQALGSGTNKRAIRGTSKQDNTAKCRFNSCPMLPVGSEALSPTEARHG
jgi:hypothetical protein